MIRKIIVIIGCVFIPALSYSALTLQQVLQSTVEHYPLIKIANQQTDIAQAQLRSAIGAFDTQVESDFKTTPQGGYENILSDTRLIFPSKKTGARAFVGYRIGQGDWPIYYKNNLTNRGGEAHIGLTFPILRDFTIDDNRGQRAIAQINTLLQKNQADTQKIEFLQEAGNTYWDWVAQGHQIRLSEDLLALAKVRQKALEKRFKLGDVGKIDVIENNRFILQREAAIVFAKFTFQRSANLLSMYHRDNQGNPIVAGLADVPKRFPGTQVTAVESILKNDPEHLILETNPNLKVIRDKQQTQQVKIDLAKNSLKPRLNAELSTAKEYGTGGDPLLAQTAYNLGLTFSVPLQLNQARGEIARRKVELMQLEDKYRFAFQELETQLNILLAEIKADRDQIKLLTKEVALVEKIEQAEKIRFNEGSSSLFLVNQREQTTFSVKLENLAANIDYYKSQVNLSYLYAFQSMSLIS